MIQNEHIEEFLRQVELTELKSVQREALSMERR